MSPCRRSRAMPASRPRSLPASSPGLLRDSLRFQGLVVTDALEMGGITSHYWTGKAAVDALRAGADLLLLPPDATVAINEVVRAVRRGDIPEAQINHSVQKVLAAKIQRGTGGTAHCSHRPHRRHRRGAREPQARPGRGRSLDYALAGRKAHPAAEPGLVCPHPERRPLFGTGPGARGGLSDGAAPPLPFSTHRLCRSPHDAGCDLGAAQKRPGSGRDRVRDCRARPVGKGERSTARQPPVFARKPDGVRKAAGLGRLRQPLRPPALSRRSDLVSARSVTPTCRTWRPPRRSRAKSPFRGECPCRFRGRRAWATG